MTYLTQDEEIPSEELNDPEFYTSIGGKIEDVIIQYSVRNLIIC